MPEWSWHSYPVSVEWPRAKSDQQLSVYLINPTINLLLNLFRVSIVVLLAWRLIRDPMVKVLTNTRQMAVPALVLVIASGALSFPGDSLAAYPPQELLKELQQRLLEPPDCLPQCAEIEYLSIRLDPEQASYCAAGTCCRGTRPAATGAIERLDTIQRDHRRRAGEHRLFRDAADALWLTIDKGVHEIAVHGNIARLHSMRLDFPAASRTTCRSRPGAGRTTARYRLSPSIRSLTFTREQSETSSNLFDTQSDIPVFARVSRHIRMGLDWQVVTTVTLESGTALPAVLRIPLLDGESVLTDTIKVDNHQVVVSLSEASRSLSWLSSLQQVDSLTLTAPRSQPWSETWSMEVTPIWNLGYSGIPVIYHQQSGGQWNPEWRPWPGEQVTLTITRPQGHRRPDPDHRTQPADAHARQACNIRGTCLHTPQFAGPAAHHHPATGRPTGIGQHRRRRAANSPGR